jgi:hypothetical protein
MFAAEQQLEAANGVNDTPFVTVKVTLDEKSQAVVEAFQVNICISISFLLPSCLFLILGE